MSDKITISSSVLPNSTRVIGFRGTERLSRPYHFEVYLRLRHEVSEEFDLADAIGAKAHISMETEPSAPPFIIAGVFANVELVHAFDEQFILRAHIVPRVWQLGLSKHSRIFTKMKIPDIISAVLEENGVTDVELRLGSYEVEDHVCQYRESDLDFISRWMEKEGIFYFFEHSDDGEKLILADAKTYDEDPLHKAVRYFPQGGPDASGRESFRAFSCVYATLPTSVRLKDYDYGKPNLPIVGKADVQSNGAGEVSLYGERLWTPTLADRYATIRAEELLAKQSLFNATGTRRHLRPGYTFDLEDHPFPSYNAKYLSVEVRHSANQSGHDAVFRNMMQMDHEDVYRVDVVAISAKLQFRAESVAIWPRIYGYENGVVDGPAESDYAQIDELGRYNAKFKFDESALKNGKATTWVRMMQPHGGTVEGFHFPLRKGTEVVFCFLGGDCDRPVIFGVVPNAVKPSPVTSGNHTRNVIQTGSYNRVEMEDQQGGQWMHLSTPASTTHLFLGAIGECDHNFVLETQGTGHLHTVGKWDVNVDDTLNETVVANVTEVYQSDTSQTVTGHKTHTILAGQTETVLAGFTQTIIAFSQRTILGPYTQMHNGPHTQTHNGPHTHTHTGPLNLSRTGTTTENLDGTWSTTVTGDVNLTVSSDVTWTIAGDVKGTCTDWNIAASGDRIFGISGTSFEHKMSDSLSITGGASVEIFAGAQLEVTIGDDADIMVGESLELTIANALEITLGTHMEFNLASGLSFAPNMTDVHLVKDGTHGMKFEEAGEVAKTSGEEVKIGGPVTFLRALATFL